MLDRNRSAARRGGQSRSAAADSANGSPASFLRKEANEEGVMICHRAWRPAALVVLGAALFAAPRARSEDAPSGPPPARIVNNLAVTLRPGTRTVHLSWSPV